MPLAVAYRLGLCVAVLSALGSVALGGQLPAVSLLALAAPFLFFFLRRAGRAAPPVSGVGIGLVSFGLGAAQIAQRGVDGVLVGAGVLVLGLLVGRLLTARTYAHDQQALLMAMLLVFSGAGLNPGLSFAPAFLVFAVAAVWTLVTSELLRGVKRVAERDGLDPGTHQNRTDIVTPAFFGVVASLSLLLLLSTTVLFVAFPRVGLRAFGLSSGQNGRFPGAVTLRGAPRGSGPSSVIARVRGVSPAQYRAGLYLRGATYEVLTADGFAEAAPDAIDAPPKALRLAPLGRKQTYQVSLQPAAADLLFSLGPISTARPTGGGTGNPNVVLPINAQERDGTLKATRPLSARFQYVVRGSVFHTIEHARSQALSRNRVPLDAPLQAALAPYLIVPERVDPRVPRLVATLKDKAGSDDPYAVAQAIRTHLLGPTFAYTLAQPAGGADDPLGAFLFDVHAGHCEYFATAYALLLRSAGIHARVVGGYYGGAWDPSGQLVVFKANNAHAWVEWFLPGLGWVVDDATPPFDPDRAVLRGTLAWREQISRFWDDNVVDYGLSEQTSMLRRGFTSLRALFSAIRGPLLPFLGGLGLLAAAVYLVRRLRARGPRQNADPLRDTLLRALHAIRGEHVPDAMTLRAAVARAQHTLAGQNGPHAAALGSALGRALSCYEEQHFARETSGAHAAAATHVQALQDAVTQWQTQHDQL